jgi:hypothetical protein
MNRFLANVDFQRASVPMNRRVRIYYMTQAAVAPPTFVLFTDRDVKLHFAFERFLANQIREPDDRDLIPLESRAIQSRDAEGSLRPVEHIRLSWNYAAKLHSRDVGEDRRQLEDQFFACLE